MTKKINKTKKRSTHHKLSYYGMTDKKMPNKKKGSSKKYDQKLQMRFEKLSVEEQEDKEQTYEAIRYLSRQPDQESQKDPGVSSRQTPCHAKRKR